METQKRDKLQFRIDLVLTVFFLVTIFGLLIGTILFEHGLFGHAFYMQYVGQLLEDPEDFTPWEWVEASIKSLDSFIASNITGTETLSKLNSTVQYALGKRLVNTGGTQMIRLNTGHLYDLQSEMSMKDSANDIVAMRDAVPEGTPFLFVYAHPTLYDEEAQMPEGYGFLDYNNRQADEILGMLRGADVDVIDSREVWRESGLPLEDFVLYTDQHWTTRAAMTIAQSIATRAEEATGVAVPSERLDIDQFDTEVYPKLFMGTYGQRVGTLIIDPDDITTYAPRYDTKIRRYTLQRGVETDVEGTFDEVNLRRDLLVPIPGKTWNMGAYMDYGLTEDYEIFTNEDGADLTILLARDSFGGAVGRFLSLVAKKVYSVDLRSYYSGTLADWLEYDPDIVVVAYSMQMLRNESYVFE